MNQLKIYFIQLNGKNKIKKNFEASEQRCRIKYQKQASEIGPNFYNYLPAAHKVWPPLVLSILFGFNFKKEKEQKI